MTEIEEFAISQKRYEKGSMNINISTGLITPPSPAPEFEPDLEQTTTAARQPVYLVTSPYTELPHLLDLNTLDTPNQLMSLALQDLQTITSSYATTPYQLTFNWSDVVTTLSRLCKSRNYAWKTTSFYCVVFTSTLRSSCNYPDLSQLDKDAHAEAMASGGFLKYWFGTPNAERKNLATCIWRSKEDARFGSMGGAHRKAASAARPSYEEYGIQGLRLIIGDDVGDWKFVQWVD